MNVEEQDTKSMVAELIAEELTDSKNDKTKILEEVLRALDDPRALYKRSILRKQQT